MKLLTAQEKAKELKISMRALAKSRHLYRYIQKSPRKFLYFEEDPREEHRPIVHVGSDKIRYKRRNVDPDKTNYSSCPGGSGQDFKLLNQMRAKASLEGKVKPGDLKYLSPAMAIKIKENAQEIVEQDQAKKRSEFFANEERARKKDPRRYGGLYNPKLVRPRYNIDLLRDQQEDKKNMQKNILENIPGTTKKYYW